MAEVDRLGELEAVLAARGEHGLRVETVRRARRFKSSWVELAEALVRVRDDGAYREWGFDDLYAYCQEELRLRRATVDKLTGSFATLERHAPQVLARDGLQEPIPSVDSVDYFARALARRDDEGDTVALEPRLADELRAAVFEDTATVSALRKRFDPVFFPRPDEAERLAALERARQAARRLDRALGEVTGMPKDLAADLDGALERLVALLEGRIAETRARVRTEEAEVTREEVRATS